MSSSEKFRSIQMTFSDPNLHFLKIEVLFGQNCASSDDLFTSKNILFELEKESDVGIETMTRSPASIPGLQAKIPGTKTSAPLRTDSPAFLDTKISFPSDPLGSFSASFKGPNQAKPQNQCRKAPLHEE